MAELINIPVNMIGQHPDNPRKDLGDLTELADSIKVNGILQNLTVVKHYGEITGEWTGCYRVIIGHRRLAAAKKAGLKEVPCVVVEMTQREQLAAMLMENMQRSDLTVYEQAQGFQMMLDLGETVESVAEASGFSTTTVRRRVKLLELDADKFKKSEARGATLSDYLELDKIEDPVLKNEVLDTIGTANFKNRLKSALEQEATKKRLMQWEAEAREFAVPCEGRNMLNSESVPMDYVRSYNTWNGKDQHVEKPEDAGTVQYYYHVGQDNISIYRDQQDVPETEEEIREREEKEAHARRVQEAEAITKRHYLLRQEFLLKDAKGAARKNKDYVCQAAVGVLFDAVGVYVRRDINIPFLSAALNLKVEGETELEEVRKRLMKAALERPEYTLLCCALADDDERRGFFRDSWNCEKAKCELVHIRNTKLESIYNCLVALGYEMSDEETAMMTGTHEVFEGSEDD